MRYVIGHGYGSVIVVVQGRYWLIVSGELIVGECRCVPVSVVNSVLGGYSYIMLGYRVGVGGRRAFRVYGLSGRVPVFRELRLKPHSGSRCVVSGRDYYLAVGDEVVSIHDVGTGFLGSYCMRGLGGDRSFSGRYHGSYLYSAAGFTGRLWFTRDGYTWNLVVNPVKNPYFKPGPSNEFQSRYYVNPALLVEEEERVNLVLPKASRRCVYYMKPAIDHEHAYLDTAILAKLYDSSYSSIGVLDNVGIASFRSKWYVGRNTLLGPKVFHWRRVNVQTTKGSPFQKYQVYKDFPEPFNKERLVYFAGIGEAYAVFELEDGNLAVLYSKFDRNGNLLEWSKPIYLDVASESIDEWLSG